jgi:membrane fusion protein, multidrug efflux system
MQPIKRYAVWLLAGCAVVAILNQVGMTVPGLGWVRLDSALSQLGIGNPPSDSRTAQGDTAQAPAAGAAKRSGAGNGGGGRRGSQDGPVPVVVAAAQVADVPVYLRGVGSARAPNTVTVRPQVDGRLMKVYFREGQDVKRGDLLADIDPATYQALLDQAVAKRNLTQVQLTNAQLDLDRYLKTGPGVTAPKTIDTQRAQVAQFEAQLKADSAAIANSQATLDYAHIASPIDGRTGQRLVDEGNLVRAGDAGIVTIAQIRPISVQFTLPQQQLGQVKTAMQAGSVLVEAMDSDDKTVLDSGALNFIDNQIDQTTGTVRMKADLPNDRLQLWPGQFANVRVRVDVLKQAVTAPTAAVQRGPTGTFVYLVVPGTGDKPKTTVSVRPVVVGQQDDMVAVVSKGLEAGEKVVTSGFARLKDQAEIVITRTQGEAAPAAAGNSPAQNPAQNPAQATGAKSAAPETSAIGTQPSEGAKPERRLRAEGDPVKSDRREKRGKPAESTVQ